MRYKLIIAYDGAAFHGWQKQYAQPDRRPLRTVAAVVEDALQRVVRQPLDLVGASRTDAGVHAQGQVAHFNADLPLPCSKLALAVNSRLPKDVEVRSAEPAADDFDAISDAIRKRYRYRIFNTARRPLGQRQYVWHCWTPLDQQRMNRAAARLIGTHDFAGFAAAGHGRTTTVRTVFDCRVEQDGIEKHVVVEGDGFLYNMVRIIAGTLAEVGRGRFEPEVIDEIIASGDRARAGPTLPASGLCLEWIQHREKGRTGDGTNGPQDNGTAGGESETRP
ncbi:MAG: tRNA pseudouridine(38-40) synthase TruA [Phycisphaeraceae bacterium]|nr:tRNA pseudouridine(38-40) synthase TruA [Phycisphaeraceae bacterium]